MAKDVAIVATECKQETVPKLSCSTLFNNLKWVTHNIDNNNITIYKAHNVRKNWIWGAGSR